MEKRYSVEDCWFAVMERIKSEEGNAFTKAWLTEEQVVNITNDLYDLHRALRDHGSPKTDWFVTLKNTKNVTGPRHTMRVKLDVYNTLKGR